MKRAEQLRLDLRAPRSHGGARPGAGRPRSEDRQSHVARPRFAPREPLHVTLRLADGRPSLRRKDMFACLRAAVRTAREGGLRIIHFAILSNHVHLILEAAGNDRLARQMQSLCISFAKRVNGALESGGAVFRERYHVEVLRTPTQVRNALRYVLTNEARHAEGGRRLERVRLRLDPYSSAFVFQDWERLLGGRNRVAWEPVYADPGFMRSWREEALSEPGTWLLRTGWTRAAA